MPPRGEMFSTPDVEAAMKDVREMEQERLDAEPVSAETLQALSEVFSMHREREAAETKKWMDAMDNIIALVESRTDQMRAEEKDAPEWDLRLKVAKGIHEIAENINTAEQLTWEAVVESQRAPEQIGLQMRMEAARDAQRSYEGLAGQVFELLSEGKDLPQGHRAQLIEMGKRLVDLIKHEQQVAELAQKNFIDNMDAKVAMYQRQINERAA